MNRELVLALTLTLLIGTLGLSFQVQRVAASGTIYIRADGSIDPPTTPISTMDNITYVFTGGINDSIVIERDDMVCDGQGYAVLGTLADYSRGIDLTGRSNVTIQNTNIKNFWSGIYAALSFGSSINGNNITNNVYGIFLSTSSDSSVSGNNITDNSVYGIELQDSSNNSISENNITNGWRGIELSNSSSNSISGNSITDYSYGFYLGYSSNNSISENTIGNSSGSGVELADYASNNSLGGNTITDSFQGITLDSASNNNIVGNNIINSDYVGILLSFSSNHNSINRNTLANNTHGIALSYSSNNTVSENTIANSSGRGVALDMALSNSMYHNNFMHNSQQVGFVQLRYNNSWDDGYPSGGNYWSDYNGTDANHNGIGDTPYIIDENNTDHYPLMAPTVIPEFPSFLILPFFFTVTLLAVIVCRRKHVQRE